MNPFQVFAQISTTAGKNDKIALLKKHDSPHLRQLLYLTYNRFLTYRIKQVDHPASYNTVQPEITDELSLLLHDLARHETGTTAAKAMIKKLLAKCTPDGATWVERIITRDLNIGINESSINKAFPGLIPVFEVQLAHPVYKKGKTPKNYWPTLQYPIICDEKLDGVRTLCVVKDGKATFFSREGHEWDERGVFAAEVLKLRPGTDFVLDGEILATKFNPNNRVAVKHREGNWPFESGKSMLKNEETTPAEVREFLSYVVWDFLELPFFASQGAEGKAIPAFERKMQLTALFERNPGVTFKNLILLPNAMAKNEAEVKELFARVRSKGGAVHAAMDSRGKSITYTVPKGEGLMLKKTQAPYGFTRNDSILKVKQFYNADLRIVGAYEGEKGSKYEGLLGGLQLASDCGTYSTDCGSGFDDEQRFDLWIQHQRSELVGLISEVSYQEITIDGSFRFPVWQGLRLDKTTTNVEDAGFDEDGEEGAE